VEGSPFNSISTVPVMPWSGSEAIGTTGARSRGRTAGCGGFAQQW
jgi:hypothetical protein